MWKQLADKQSDGEEDRRFSVCNFEGWLLLVAITLGLVVTLSISSLHHKRVLGIQLRRCELSVMMVLGSRLACKRA
ncbi:hypothetical protein Bca4012_053953 [Brassica carinata]